MKHYPSRFKTTALALLISGCAVATTPSLVWAQDDAESASTPTLEVMKSTLDEGWKKGVIEGAYLFNTNLNPFDIDVKVFGDTATLSGNVSTDTEKALAEEIALSVDGITNVNNKLDVDPKASQSMKQHSDSVMADISDAAITAKVKSKLLASTDVSGLDVNVDTDDHVVTLRGQVASDAERDLAYYITRNTHGVTQINNELTVKES